MKVLLVGSGGREHAIVWKLKQSPKIDKIYCAPGNAGIAQDAQCVPIGAMEIDKLVSFAKEEGIDFTIIGMDDPLVAGVVDAFEAEGLKVFGPNGLGQCQAGAGKRRAPLCPGRSGLLSGGHHHRRRVRLAAKRVRGRTGPGAGGGGGKG